MNYYIYIYLDRFKKGSFQYEDLIFNNEPFYVGKGTKNRKISHMSQCFNKKDKRKYRSLFYRKLRKLITSKNPPEILVYKKDLSENEAFNLEVELVEIIGKRIENRGPLCNISNGGEGKSGTKSYRTPISVYNNEGILIDTVKTSTECSIKYNVKLQTIYKHCIGLRTLPINGLRFRKAKLKLSMINVAPIKRKKVKNYKITSLSKPIVILDNSNNIVHEFPNIRIASEELKVSATMLRNRANGILKRFNKLKEYKVKYK